MATEKLEKEKIYHNTTGENVDDMAMNKVMMRIEKKEHAIGKDRATGRRSNMGTRYMRDMYEVETLKNLINETKNIN